MIYLDELSLKREMILINNSKILKEDPESVPNELKGYSDFKLLDKLQEEYRDESYNIKKARLEENFIKEVQKHYIENYSKEEFGVMLLILIKNILKKHCFAGYTQEWKEDFSIDATEKVFKYMHNFDATKISERSGRKVKAFAYLTQIITQAFISVINKRNIEKAKAQEYDTISYNSLYSDKILDSVLQHKENKNSTYHNTDEEYFKVKVPDKIAVFEYIKKLKPNKHINLEFILPDTEASFSIEEYNYYTNLMSKIKANIIITHEYLKEKEAQRLLELQENNAFTDFGEAEMEDMYVW